MPKLPVFYKHDCKDSIVIHLGNLYGAEGMTGVSNFIYNVHFLFIMAGKLHKVSEH